VPQQKVAQACSLGALGAAGEVEAAEVEAVRSVGAVGEVRSVGVAGGAGWRSNPQASQHDNEAMAAKIAQDGERSANS